MANVPAYDIAAWRRQVPLLDSAIPLHHCSQAPATRPALDAAARWLESWTTKGMDWEAWLEEVEGARDAFAALVGAEPDEVSVATSVSEATARFASALDFTGRRNAVVLSAAEFPGVGHVWQAQAARGAEIRWVPLRDGVTRVEDWAAAVDDRTLVVSACRVYYQNGFRQDDPAIGALAREHGALLYVDAYQALGAEPVDVRALGADALAGGCLKYLLGTSGLAFLYVRRELAERHRPTATGWLGRTAPYAFDVRTLDWGRGARRFDGGTPPVANAYVCRAGLEAIRRVGPEAIAAWGRVLGARLLEGAAARGLEVHGPRAASDKTAMTAIVCPDPSAVDRALRARGVIGAPRGPALRLAPHFYSTLEDVDRALDALADLLQGARA